MNPRPFRAELLALAAVTLLAGLLRMGWPGIAEFKADEAHLLALALDMVQGRAFPLRGIGSSVGLPNSPLSVYLFALPLLFARDPLLAPLAAGLFAGALNTLSVAGAWWLARRYFGRGAGLLAALFYAASPWAALYSRKAWAQDLLPAFVTAWAISGLLALVEGRRRWLAPHMALLALAAQIHLSALALLPVSGLALLLFRRRVERRALLWGGALAGLSLLPVTLYALAHRADLLPALAGLAGRAPVYSLRAPWMAWLTSAGADLHSLAGPRAFRDYLSRLPPPALWLLPATLILALGLLALVDRVRRARRAPAGDAALFLLLWLALPVLLFVRETTPVFPHYFILLYPAQYVAAGAGLSALAARLPRLRAGLAGLALGVAGLQTWAFLALLGFVATRATPGGFGVPLRLLLAPAARLRAEMAAGAGGEILVVGQGGDPAQDETPAVFAVLLRGLPVRFVDGREAAVFPASPTWALLWPQALPAGALYPAGERFPLRAGEGAARLVQLSGQQAVSLPGSIPPPRLLANGVDLLGYRAGGQFAPGGEVWWWLDWRPGAAEAGDAYHFFNHVLAADGQRVAGADGPGFPSGAWRAGDRVISLFQLQLAPGEYRGPYRVAVGMYRYPTLEAVPLLDQAGNPGAPALLLGPFP